MHVLGYRGQNRRWSVAYTTDDCQSVDVAPFYQIEVHLPSDKIEENLERTSQIWNKITTVITPAHSQLKVLKHTFRHFSLHV